MLSAHPDLVEDPYAHVGEYSGPIAAVLGREDTHVGSRDALSAFENHPSASVDVLHPAGHTLHLDRREVMAALFREWLGRMPSSGRAV